MLTDHGLERGGPGARAAGAPAGRVDLDEGERPSEAVEVAAYFVVSEALTNVAKYAPRAHASVEVRALGDRLLVVVSDDGAGGADHRGGSGLRGLEDRVEALGGRLHVQSVPGEGTSVRADLPLVMGEVLA